MACSSCAKKRYAAGRHQLVPLILGQDDGSPTRFVKVVAAGIVPTFAVGSNVYVRGTIAEQHIESGELELLKTILGSGSTGGSRLYCVGEGNDEVCFPSLEAARTHSTATGWSINVKTTGQVA